MGFTKTWPVFVLSIGVAFIAMPLPAPAGPVDPQLIFADSFEAPPPVNQPPLVDAGDDQTITLPATAILAGSASDDGLPVPPGALTLAWSKLSGPGSVDFDNPAAAATSATFSVDGVYVLRLTASDGALDSFDDVQITANPEDNPPGPQLDYAGTIGPSGGEISAHQGRVLLVFPPGAVLEDTDIRVSPLANVGAPGVITSTAFDFGPDGLEFLEPVTLTLSYAEVGLPAEYDATALIIVSSSLVSGALTPVPGSTVATAAHTVTATISGFSTYGTAIPNCASYGGDPQMPWCPARCTEPPPPSPNDPGGALDPSFGTNGVFTFALGIPGATGVDDLLMDSQGRLLLAVEKTRMGVARILPNGEGFDLGFGINGIAQLSSAEPDNTPRSVTLRTDARILLYGAQQPPGGGIYTQIARFMPNGALDTSFGANGVALDTRQNNYLGGDLATLPDGRMFATDPNQRKLYQFLPDGSPDPGFGVDGIASNNTLFTGNRSLRRATGDWLVTRGKDILEIDAQGNPGTQYTTPLQVYAVTAGFEEVPGGGYVLGGSLPLSGSYTPFGARYVPGDDPGSLEPDTCFGKDEFEVGYGFRTYNIGGSNNVTSMAVQADGRIILAGATTDQDTDDDLFVIRIRPDGEIDTGFGVNGIVYLDFGGDEQDGSVVIDSQGRIVIAGSSRVGDSISGVRTGVIARILP